MKDEPELPGQDQDFEISVGRFLAKLGFAEESEKLTFEPLTGGVSSDIWKVVSSRGEYCVKQALPRLKVAAKWEVSCERSHFEAEWLRVAGAIRPLNVPELIAEDTERGRIVMRYLPPRRYASWKEQLRDGHASSSFAAAAAATLAAIHAATANDEAIAARFATDENFRAIRLEPYLEATALAHDSLAEILIALSKRTARTKRCLVHGDVSPKNILVAPEGPILLDAECAWYGDPAFDVAFLLNHLLLKCLWNPNARPAFLSCFLRIADVYHGAVTWEEPSALEARAATLLPALMLARIDGKSPVEYLTAENDKALVRRFARHWLLHPMERLADISQAWQKELQA